MLYIAARATPDCEAIDQVLGVSDTEAAAVRRCTMMMDFVGPIELNAALPEEGVEWAGAYYPNADKE